jgi:hypothetical protein
MTQLAIYVTRGLLQTVRDVDLGIYHFIVRFVRNHLLKQREANNHVKSGTFWAMYLRFRICPDRGSRCIATAGFP